MKLVCRGLTAKAISVELGITENTVKFHLANARRSLGAANVAEAAVIFDRASRAEIPLRAIEIAVDAALGEIARQTGNGVPDQLMREARNTGVSCGQSLVRSV